jgi:hypothetical protein
MNTADRQIAEILAKYDEDFAPNIWRVQGTAVIYHKALERIAVRAKITFDPPNFLRTERDEAVIHVTGRMGERVEWSIGEALMGVNYRVSGKQAAYVYAIAEKRAKDRVILKLIELHGLVYSEEEADDFKNARPEAVPVPPAKDVAQVGEAAAANTPPSPPIETREIVATLPPFKVTKSSERNGYRHAKGREVEPPPWNPDR